jgi:hypothetical protein
MTSVDSNDILYNRMQFFHYYGITVQYITYSVNTAQYITGVHLQYITVVPYLVRKYCTVLMSVVLNPPNEYSTIGGKKLLPAIYRP